MIAGSVEAMREAFTPVKSHSDRAVDTCGTGGDGANTFNISTASAFVAAGAGAIVAKHGNKSVSSQCGSADVLEALGVNLNIEQQHLSDCLDEVGIAFLFAQKLHPAMKNVASVRKKLGVETIFNILGPLTNPAQATHHASTPALRRPIRSSSKSTTIHIVHSRATRNRIGCAKVCRISAEASPW